MKLVMKENGLRTELEYGVLDISGNEEYGFRPYQLMVASIAGCSGSVFRKILEKQRTEIDDMQITAEVERNPEEANRIEKITLNFKVQGKNLDPAKLQKNLEISRKNCSMVRSVEGSIQIEEKIETIELSN
ncbi:OsmC family protein [Virgibacillus halodenitrificans]|jgi:putative redox protein|uniref:OsmC family protein n=1 Tax=Virgibacillus halodenitrificans TaxID=1482 RepID=A0AAC9IW23_VIRHA|nr:OsmC family protein [Virgibacillus halodenitrificans]APC47236.1 osmotically inducible protein C [Virgibacillus halodenitrificans]MBD1223680.1 OsmC family protein [Virgibacillus halodenitrificans]MCG1028057.1 OsmC family protein [Virgibacillus halodenitrificans]MCJ0933339.1 OsmC family protein [Virgibacillus halodenitrificans]MEC2159325.1 OsmC family protein [Virgibacillus halodenitrificans]